MDVRRGEGTIMMALFGLLEKEENREAMLFKLKAAETSMP